MYVSSEEVDFPVITKMQDDWYKKAWLWQV